MSGDGQPVVALREWQSTGFEELTMDDLIGKLGEELELENTSVEKEVRSIRDRIHLESTKTDSEEGESTETRIGKLKLKRKRKEENWKVKKMGYWARIKRIFEDMNCTSAQSSLKLQFMCKMSKFIYTGGEIKGAGNVSIEVALVDDAGDIVDTGPAASATIETVVLKGEAESCEGGDLTVEEFNGKIVQEMHRKGPILQGNVRLKLQQGVAVLDNIKFRHNAIQMKPPVFRLGAQVIEQISGVRVKEAQTEPFIVKDYRKKYSEKHEIPSLNDPVFRLVNIGKGGVIEQRLAESNISTVEHFLVQLLIDPEGLKRIVGLPTKKWELIVDNARACPDKRMYCYINCQQKTGVVFNVLGDVLGLYLESQYAPISTLSENHKADAQELRASAYKHWEDVKSFHDKNSLHQHVIGLIASIDPPDCLEPIGESSNGHSNCSFWRRFLEGNSCGHSDHLTSSRPENIGRIFCPESDCTFEESDRTFDLDDFNQIGNSPSQTIDTVGELLQFLEEDRPLQSGNLEFSADVQSPIDDFLPWSAVPINRDPSGWTTLSIVLRWCFSIKRIRSIKAKKAVPCQYSR